MLEAVNNQLTTPVNSQLAVTTVYWRGDFWYLDTIIMQLGIPLYRNNQKAVHSMN